MMLNPQSVKTLVKKYKAACREGGLTWAKGNGVDLNVLFNQHLLHILIKTSGSLFVSPYNYKKSSSE